MKTENLIQALVKLDPTGKMDVIVKKLDPISLEEVEEKIVLNCMPEGYIILKKTAIDNIIELILVSSNTLNNIMHFQDEKTASFIIDSIKKAQKKATTMSIYRNRKSL